MKILKFYGVMNWNQRLHLARGRDSRKALCGKRKMFSTGYEFEHEGEPTLMCCRSCFRFMNARFKSERSRGRG